MSSVVAKHNLFGVLWHCWLCTPSSAGCCSHQIPVLSLLLSRCTPISTSPSSATFARKNWCGWNSSLQTEEAQSCCNFWSADGASTLYRRVALFRAVLRNQSKLVGVVDFDLLSGLAQKSERVNSNQLVSREIKVWIAFSRYWIWEKT